MEIIYLKALRINIQNKMDNLLKDSKYVSQKTLAQYGAYKDVIEQITYLESKIEECENEL